MGALRKFYRDTVSVRAKEGIYDTYGAPVQVTCMVDETTRLVRGADGAEVVSSSTIYAPPERAAVLVQGAEVTLPSGDVTSILSRSVRRFGRLSHVEAACQ